MTISRTLCYLVAILSMSGFTGCGTATHSIDEKQQLISSTSAVDEEQIKEKTMSASGTFDVKLEPQKDDSAPAGRQDDHRQGIFW